MSKIAVIGAGYVGLTTAACLADLGNSVTVVDVNEQKIADLKKNRVPFYEPGINELVERNSRAGRLVFTTSYADAVPGAEYAIIAVSTPEGEGGEADLSYVESAATSIAEAMDGPLVVVNKSTVPPLTGDMVSAVLRKKNSKYPVAVVSNPEFLREGSAIQDFMNPDRVVVGSHDRSAAEKVAQLYAPLEAPVVVTPNIYTAEMIKYASNAFLATKISFINEIARISERVGADAKLVAEGMGLDERIGPRFLDAGIGYGGSCLAGSETALVRRQGRTRLASLAEIFEQFDRAGDTTVLAWERSSGSVRFLPVSAATIRPFAGDMFEIRTRMGRRVRCTPDHPFVTRDGTKLASELTTADWLPLAVDRAEEPLAAGAELQRAKLIESTAGVRPLTVPPALESRRPQGTLRAGAPTAGFWRVVGLQIAAGHAGDDRRRERIRLPDQIWDQPAEHKRALLSGYWQGAGSWSQVDGGRSVVLECGPTSPELADGLLRLLADLGVVASLHAGRAAGSTREAYLIRCSGAEQVERLLELVPDQERPAAVASVGRQKGRLRSTGYRREGRHTAWVRITDIRRSRFAGPVYSLEVPGAHTFVTTAGLITHNCFPKDVAALAAVAERFDYHPELLHAVMDINRDQRMLVIDKLRECLDQLAGSTIGLLGLAFKPNTDDMREAPSVDISRVLLAAGADVRAYDPAAIETARRLVPDVTYVGSAYEVATGADALVLVTEWNEFRRLDMARVKQLMRRPIIIDGRNIYEPEAMKEMGFTYRGVGRE